MAIGTAFLGILILFGDANVTAEPPPVPLAERPRVAIHTIGYGGLKDRRASALKRTLQFVPESLSHSIEQDSAGHFGDGLAIVLLPSLQIADRPETRRHHSGTGMYFANFNATMTPLSPWPLAAVPPKDADHGDMRRWIGPPQLVHHYWSTFADQVANAKLLGRVYTGSLTNHPRAWMISRIREDGQRFSKPTSYIGFPIADANPPRSKGSNQPDPDRNGPFQSRIFSDLPFDNWGTHHEIIVPMPMPQSRPVGGRGSPSEWIVVPERLSELDPPIVVFSGEDAQGNPSSRDWRITHSPLPGEVEHAKIIVIFDNISDADLRAALESLAHAQPSDPEPSDPQPPGR